MQQLLLQSVHVFLYVLDIFVFLYILFSWIQVSAKVRAFISMLVQPILTPIQFLLKRSILHVQQLDFSPMIAFLVISYLQYFVKSYMI